MTNGIWYIERGKTGGTDGSLNSQFASNDAAGFATQRIEGPRRGANPPRAFSCADRGFPGLRCVGAFSRPRGQKGIESETGHGFKGRRVGAGSYEGDPNFGLQRCGSTGRRGFSGLRAGIRSCKAAYVPVRQCHSTKTGRKYQPKSAALSLSRKPQLELAFPMPELKARGKAALCAEGVNSEA